MADDVDKTADKKPVPGPGVTAWLPAIVGAPRPSRAKSAPPLPPGFGPKIEARRIDIHLPEEVVVAESGTLQRIEIRGLPAGVSLTAGAAMKDGFWHLSPEDLYGIAAVVPKGIDLPFSVMLKGVFVGEDPETPWTELTGYEFADDAAAKVTLARHVAPEPDTSADQAERVNDMEPAPEPEPQPEIETEEVQAAVPEPAPEIETESEPDSQAPQPATMIVIELDVSVGIDDPDTLKDIILHFSGLPHGAMLTAGHAEDGVWSVPATALSDLAVVIPEETPNFDLDVEMVIAGSPPQSATIQVENTPQDADPDSAFHIHLAGDDAAGLTRISVYTDGVLAYDRVVNWGAAQTVSLLVPFTEAGLPFEVLMRYAAFGTENTQPILTGLVIDGVDVPPTSPAIVANGTAAADGLKWSGDLVFDVRAATKPPLAEPESEAGAFAHAPSEMSEPTAALESFDGKPDTSAQSEDILAPDQPPAPETDDIPDTDVSDQVLNDADDVSLEPSAASEGFVDEPEKEAGDVLIVDATFDDLQRPAFISELRNLRDFIRTRPADHNGEIYDRLGIDVTKWHDMSVRGPSGAEVDLEPRLPRIAPRGGIDNTRDLIPVELGEFADVFGGEVRISGMRPGALLTHGRNLGSGVWQIAARDCAKVGFLPPIGFTGVTALHVAWAAADKKNAVFKLEKSLIVGQSRNRPAFSGTDMPTMSIVLDAETFDPGGHGSLSLTVGEMPPGTVLSKGKNHGGGVWTLETATGDRIALSAAAATAPFHITLTCVALNPETGDSTVVSRVLEAMPGQGKLRVRSEMAA